YLRGEKTPKMPMGGSIPETTIATLTAAIDEMKPVAATAKASYAEWLFSKPQPPAVPPARQDSIANPVDAFILARLEAKSLSPAPPAGRRALLRRVYLAPIRPLP